MKEAAEEETVATSSPCYSVEKLSIERGRLKAYDLDDFVDGGLANKAKAVLALALEE